MDLVLNWCWQGALLALITTVLSSSRRVSASTRYWLLWLALVAVLALPLLSMLGPAPAAESGAAPPIEGFSPLAVPAASPSLLLLMAGAWCAWILIASARTYAAAAQLRRLRRDARPFPPDVAATLTVWPTLHGRRPVRLAVSDGIAGVSMLGLGRPIVAVSRAVVRTLPPADLDRILRHEWAHAQRFDDYARLAQAAVRAVAGFHPAVALLNWRIDLEREAACDDFAAATHDAPGLARTLARLALLGAGRRDLLETGALTGASVTVRVARLLDGRRNRMPRRSRAALLVAVPAIFAAALLLAGTVLVATVNPSDAPVPPPAASLAPIEAPAAVTSSPMIPLAQRQLPDADATRQPDDASVSHDARPATSEPAAPPASREIDPIRPRANSPVRVNAAAIAPHHDADRTSWTMPRLRTAATPAGGAPASGSMTIERRADDATPWGAAADAGVSMGRSWQKAGSATGRFFTGMAKRIGGGF